MERLELHCSAAHHPTRPLILRRRVCGRIHATSPLPARLERAPSSRCLRAQHRFLRSFSSQRIVTGLRADLSRPAPPLLRRAPAPVVPRPLRFHRRNVSVPFAPPPAHEAVVAFPTCAHQAPRNGPRETASRKEWFGGSMKRP